MKEATKSRKGKAGSLAKKGKTKRITKSANSRPGKKAGRSETNKEREQRLAKREALTILAFQMSYDSYHQE